MKSAEKEAIFEVLRARPGRWGFYKVRIGFECWYQPRATVISLRTGKITTLVG